MFISVILPTYREAANLRVLVPQICAELSSHRHEVIVVDDNSPDETPQVIQELQKQQLSVKLIVRTKNRGFANSIREGLESAQGDHLIIMDSDGNHNPKYLPFMCMSAKFYPCVIASRFQYGGGMDSKSRQILSWLFNIFVRAITGGYATDSLYGFIIVRKEVLADLNFDKIFWGYGDYCIRLLFYIQRNKVPILQFPAKNGTRTHGIGNSRFLKVFWQYFTESIKLVMRERILSGNKD